MKNSLLIFLITALHASASVFSHGQSLSFTAENKTVREVFRQIEDETSYRFFYNEEFSDLSKPVSFEVHDYQITDLMDIMLSSSNVTYRILENDLVVITPMINENQERVINGNVTDASTGEPLIGVTVVIQGTTVGTTTDIDGNYSLALPEEGVTIEFSFVGYSKRQVVVDEQETINISLEQDLIGLDEVVVIGYGSVSKSDLTGAVMSVSGDDFRTQPSTQVTEMLSGTVAGFYSNQSASAAGGGSLEVRGPTSLTAGTEPLIVLDGVIFSGSLSDINPADIESIDIMKDASSSAIFGAKAAAGIVLITTTKGTPGKPTINFSSKVGVSENYNERRGLGPDEYVQFRQDYFRQMFVDRDYNYYTNPDNLDEAGISLDQWLNLADAPLEDPENEWLTRMRFFPEEQKAYRSGETIDWYDKVFRNALRQDYHLSIGGGSDDLTYYWSIGYNNNEGLRLGDQFSSIRTRINTEWNVVDWLQAGINAQFSDRDESSVPVSSTGFYSNSPFAQMWTEEGYLKRYPHGHTNNPLLDYYRVSRFDKTNNLFANIYADITLPFDIVYRFSFQPRYRNYKYLNFVTISEELGGAGETPTGRRDESTRMDWMIDNLITWNRRIGIHNFDVTLLANIEENRYWSTRMDNRNFSPNQELIYHGLHFGDSPEINVNDTRNTGDALMARLNYTLMDRYLLTASIRRDGYSAFGTENPRATFPAFALAWVVSEEDFFNSSLINWLKLRASWGANGNRDIGMYSALAETGSDLWYDGSNTRVGVVNSTLANPGLRWERTSALNFGFDLALFESKIYLTADVYDMTTTDLLMDRTLPRVTGFNNITANLGELRNRGIDMTLNTRNIIRSNFSWRSDFVFSLNRNEIIRLFGDIGPYTLLGEEREGELPDFSNEWFPGQSIDVVWDYDVTGIWQLDEASEAARYDLEPGDFKAVDVDDDGRYVDLEDKRFIGHTTPRYRLGFKNDFEFLQNFTASVFIRADLGHIGSYSAALNNGHESNDRRNRNVGPVPYWTADNPDDEYARLNTLRSPFGGGIMIYKPRSFVRIQDLSLSYRIPAAIVQRMGIIDLNVFGSVRNLATFTNWPGWDPESEEPNTEPGMTPMPRTYTFGLNVSL
ncbi:MAG: SusC/RagA family TonB-linked outer membrane protein [Bacteroidales bacterium]